MDALACFRRALKSALRAVVLALPAAALPFGGPLPYASTPQNPDYIAGESAIQAKDWAGAIGYFSRLTDDAFRHYDKALALDPKHRGAHEYIGEAYLIAGDLAKAEEHLAILDKLCFFGCEEYSELKKKIAEYKRKQ
ncbi:MAG: tetratricopeptide repeat protein [Proteobacteria bacterium]|nr:tetratricopeptide repeat protein [Pseudomonadota bacterium]